MSTTNLIRTHECESLPFIHKCRCFLIEKSSAEISLNLQDFHARGPVYAFLPFALARQAPKMA
jgi:hypothetical protein